MHKKRGYKRDTPVELVRDYKLFAIENAKAVDSDPKHFMPGFKETKVYQLGEAIMQVIGKNDFDKFIESTLPKLINAEKVRSKKKHL